MTTAYLIDGKWCEGGRVEAHIGWECEYCGSAVEETTVSAPGITPSDERECPYCGRVNEIELEIDEDDI